MRPEKAIMNIQKAINSSIKLKSFYPLKKVKKELLKLRDIHYRIEFDPEHELIENYYEGDNHYSTLLYISDRWGCYGRIGWLLSVIDKEMKE